MLNNASECVCVVCVLGAWGKSDVDLNVPSVYTGLDVHLFSGTVCGGRDSAGVRSWYIAWKPSLMERLWNDRFGHYLVQKSSWICFQDKSTLFVTSCTSIDEKRTMLRFVKLQRLWRHQLPLTKTLFNFRIQLGLNQYLCNVTAVTWVVSGCMNLISLPCASESAGEFEIHCLFISQKPMCVFPQCLGSLTWTTRALEFIYPCCL